MSVLSTVKNTLQKETTKRSRYFLQFRSYLINNSKHRTGERAKFENHFIIYNTCLERTRYIVIENKDRRA